MRTRREVLIGVAAVPLAGALSRSAFPLVSRKPEIIDEPNCLSQESASGFRLVLQQCSHFVSPFSPRLLIFPASRRLSRQAAFELREQAARGTWVILESGLCFMRQEEAMPQIRLLREAFGIDAQPPVAHSGGYIEYFWPVPRLVRDFSTITPLNCERSQRIAESRGIAVASKRSFGKGGIIFLGSLLGPALLADEREAQELASAILASLRYLHPCRL